MPVDRCVWHHPAPINLGSQLWVKTVQPTVQTDIALAMSHGEPSSLVTAINSAWVKTPESPSACHHFEPIRVIC